MSNYELYEDVINGLDKENFSAYARNWIEGAEEAHFEDNEANELFINAKYLCRLWRSKAINGRVSKNRMIECVRKIAEKKLPNPYENPAAEVIEEPTEKPAEEPTHILGVVPEEKTFFGKRKKR